MTAQSPFLINFADQQRNYSNLSMLSPWEEDEAKVTETIQPGRKGRIRFQSSEWYARNLQGLTLLPGTTVRVIGHQNITWYVEFEGEVDSDRVQASNH